MAHQVLAIASADPPAPSVTCPPKGGRFAERLIHFRELSDLRSASKNKKQTMNVLVIHSNGATSIARRGRANAVVAAGLAYWRDPAKRVLMILKSTDDKPNPGYEYGGKKSFSRHPTVQYCDIQTRALITVPLAFHDRTRIMVAEPGGSQVMQLKPLEDRRGPGRHIPMPQDRLWRPVRKKRQIASIVQIHDVNL
jgi:hypothetical protein